MAQVSHTPADHLVCVLLDIHIWSGRQHLEKSDLIRSNPEFSKLPEKELANLGSVKICDPDDIRQFHTLKGQAERILGRAGLPMLGAIGVPADRFNEVHDELVGIQQQFRALAQRFIAAYNQRIAAWKARHLSTNPDWAPLFNHVPPATHVAGRLGFDFHPFRISAPAGTAPSALNVRFDQQLHGLNGELMNEVAVEANRLVATCLERDSDGNAGQQRRDHVAQRSIGPLRRAADKLTSFRFIDPDVGPLAEVIQGVLAHLPAAGRIDGAGLMRLWSLAAMLSTPQQAADVARRAQQGDRSDDILELKYSGEVTGIADGVTMAAAVAEQSDSASESSGEAVLEEAGVQHDLSLLL